MLERPIAIVGAGAWGTALAVHLADRGQPVRLWVRETDLLGPMRAGRENTLFLPGVKLPAGVDPSPSLPEVVEDAPLVLFVVPAQFSRAVLRTMAGALSPTATLVLASKGIEEHSLALPLQVAQEELGDRCDQAVLSGPSFASELARGLPTAVVVASRVPAAALRVQESLSSPTLRIYTSADPLGVQLAGALKNVMAIAAGVADSLETGGNGRAALITRGLAEISRLGQAMGARQSTFSGLAGLGDLVLTCTGGLSRNRQVGQRLGQGESLDQILATTRSVAEGVCTTRSAHDLARREGVEMPIVDEVHHLLFGGGDPGRTVSRLMGRPLTAEQPQPDGPE